MFCKYEKTNENLHLNEMRMLFVNSQKANVRIITDLICISFYSNGVIVHDKFQILKQILDELIRKATLLSYILLDDFSMN